MRINIENNKENTESSSNKKSGNILKDLFLVISTNLLSLLSGVVTSLIIPKYLGVSEYGSLMIFTFYVTYVSVLQFGYNDGIYIRFGNYDYDELPREKFRMYFWFLLASQIFLSIVLFIIFKFTVKDPVRMNIFMIICFNVVFSNVFFFFNLINQITRRFKLYSLSLVVTKLFYVISSFLFILLGIRNHVFFMVSLTLINLLVLIINMLNSKEIIFGIKERIRDNLRDLAENALVGIPQLIGNFMVTLIVGTSRLFIDKFFTLTDFAVYSFAVSLLSIVYLFIGAISTVVYPYLARTSKENLHILYTRMKFVVLILISLSLSSYFLLNIFVRTVLPKYSASLEISLLLFTTILFRSQVDVVSRNFYKVMKLQKEYTINNIVAFIISFIAAFIAFITLKSTIGMAISAAITFFIWMIYTDYYFIRKLGLNLAKMHLCEILIVGVFLASGFLLNWYMGFSLYLVGLLAIIFAFYKSDIIYLIKQKADYFKV